MADLHYRRFDSLMSSVKGRLHLFSENNLIKDANYISVARAINSELGIKINQQLETEIDVEDYKAYLPENCLSISCAVAVVDKNECFKLDTHNFNLDIWKRKGINIYSLSPTRRSINRFSKYSFNINCISSYQIDVDETELSFNFEKGKVLLAYTADMTDEEGSLLVLDHPLVNQYYEAAITAQVLKDLWYNMDADTYQKYQNENLAVLPALKTKANGIINFPGYRRMREYQKQIEKKFYQKYYSYIV